MKMRRLILIELNEINFDIVQRYIEAGDLPLPALRSLLSGPRIRTTCEREYELLEPWIQWPSAHTGLDYEGHRIFRLGDMAEADIPQFFEQLEERGLLVGAISAMNAVNRLRTPAYFVPDPWTATPSGGPFWATVLSKAISQAVNDNAHGKIELSSAFWLLLGLFRFARFKNYASYVRLALSGMRSSWRKALFLDQFLHDLHFQLFQRYRPDFSTLFLNAGAHIQHHYFFNAEPVRRTTLLRNPAWYISPDADPIADMLCVYDRIVADYLRLDGVDVIVATGLSQRPYDRVKFYYRLKDHDAFLALLGIRFRCVRPRMTRDFLIEFDSEADAQIAERRLGNVVVCGAGEKLFAHVDNRGRSLFVTLTYPNEIRVDTRFEFEGRGYSLADHVAFVAIKNGMHQGDGFAFFKGDVESFAPPDGSHVRALYATIMSYFGALSGRAVVPLGGRNSMDKADQGAGERQLAGVGGS